MTKPGAIPELLAPAGTIESGLAAFDAGADAIYAGLPRFNARERGRNCSLEDISRLVAYARKRGRAVYVTLNTLIKECELEAVAEILAQLDAVRPDAVIVQDLGVVRMIREYFPALTIHASTQMGVHNSAGARVAERLGIRRVILERQITLREIERIRKHASIELEVFVHGALCCSRSGVCLFSSWMGGWSGNRGRCKQPCRRRYFSRDGNGFFFSTGDLYSLDVVPQLKALGVSSLKIEGRLRQADYVERVVSAYRMVLDAATGEEQGVLKEARGVLSGALGRKWTPALATQKQFKGVVQPRSLGASGLLCGKVVKTGRGRFLVRASRPIGSGDTLRVQPPSGDEGPVLTATKLVVDGKKVRHVRKSQEFWVFCDKNVDTGALVYRTAGPKRDMQSRIAALPGARPVLDFDVAVGLSEIRVDALGWVSPVSASPARNRPLGAGQVAEEFGKSGDAPFAGGRIRANVQGDIFLPASRLKQLRREFWDWAASNVLPEALRDANRKRLQSLYAELEKTTAVTGRVRPETTIRTSPGRAATLKRAFTAHPVAAVGRRTNEAILPDFCPEPELPVLKEQVAAAIRKGVRRFRVTSLYGLEVLGAYGGAASCAGRSETGPARVPLKLTASFPLPVCNSFAVRELTGLGAGKCTAWVELEKEALKDLADRCGATLEVFSYGRLPLLSTRFELPVEGQITDARGGAFTIRREGGLTNLYPDKVFAVPEPAGMSLYVDLSHAAPNEKETDSFNYSRALG